MDVERKLKVFRETPKKIDLVGDNVKVDFCVIRDETAPLRLVKNRENAYFLNSAIQVLHIRYYCLEIILTNYILWKE